MRSGAIEVSWFVIVVWYGVLDLVMWGGRGVERVRILFRGRQSVVSGGVTR